jgi:hypothetical protein
MSDQEKVTTDKTAKKMNLYQKLHHIQCEILGLSKNKKSFGYSYVNGDKVLEYIKPLMNELGLILKQEIISIKNKRHDYQTGSAEKKNLKDKSEILSKVMMRFTWIDTDTGEKDENSFGANGMNDWEKGLGSALTYGERYFLLKFFHIATDQDDIDNPDRKPQAASQTQAPQQTAPQPNAKPKMTQVAFDNAMKLTDVNTLNKGLAYYDMTEDQTNNILSLIDNLEKGV